MRLGIMQHNGMLSQACVSLSQFSLAVDHPGHGSNPGTNWRLPWQNLGIGSSVAEKRQLRPWHTFIMSENCSKWPAPAVPTWAALARDPLTSHAT